METKLIYLIILLLFINNEAKSQTETNLFSKHVIYLEIAGIGGYASLNYERKIVEKTKLDVSARIGLSTYNFSDYTNKFNPDIIVPISINGLYGIHHKLEIGIGQTISNIVEVNHSNWRPERTTNLHANFTIGYRYQKDTGGIIFRCSYTPIIEFYRFYRHWGGTSIGYAF